MKGISLLGLVPGAAALGTAAWLGSFYGSASFVGLTGLCLLVLGLAAAAGPGWLDPLRLGRLGNLVLALLLALLVASCIASPVMRAGRTALLLVPAFLLLPAVFARCWKREETLERGLLGISVAVLVVGAWALLDLGLGSSTQAAMPLGHHRLLASWLVCLLPLACLGARRPGLPRVFALTSGLIGAAAVLASQSLLGAVALGCEVVALAVVLWLRARPPYRRGIVLVLVAVLLAVALPNLGRGRDLMRLEDSSLQARSVYWQAGWSGLAERPWLGWGPGATPWTLASFLHPRPGLNPPGELVGDLHNLPLHLAYELGWPALLVVTILAIVFWRRRWKLAKERGRGTVAAALVGFAAFAVSSLGGAPLGIGALPMALAVVAGAGLAGAGLAGSNLATPHRSRLRWIPAAYSVVALALLVSPLWAHYAYEKARTAPDSQGLARAVDLDPTFPLYQERLALAEGDLLRAWKAASAAPGVASPWLVAGALAAKTQPSIAGGFLGEACRLDPLGAAAPFLLLTAEPGSVEAPRRGARALLADPRLLASPWWRDRGDLLSRTVQVMQRLDGVDAGWRLSLQAAARAVADHPTVAEGEEAEWPRLAVVADSRPGVSFSLHLFRRLPWPRELLTFALDPVALERVDLPAAAILPSTAPEVFQASGCGLSENSLAPGP